jgi:hypothetical protein
MTYQIRCRKVLRVTTLACKPNILWCKARSTDQIGGGFSNVAALLLSPEQDRKTIVDPEGVELADLDAARKDAVMSARELMNDDVLRGRAADGRQFLITDEGAPW